MLGCPVEATCSPEVQRKIVAASTEARSYKTASTLLEELAGLDIPAKQCERITQRIGRERIAERESRLEDYQQLALPEQQQAPPTTGSMSWENRVAGVLFDGGRAQVRDERWGQSHPPGESRSWWREPKVACFATFSSPKHATDPLPDVPTCLLDPLRVIPRVKEIKGGRCGAAEGDVWAPEATPSPREKPPRWSPKPLVKSVVATFQPYEVLGRLAQAEAYHRGFAAADRKVFLGDRHLSNWAIHERQFSHYTPVTDILHALSYVYHAALESTPDMEACWQRCQLWITWVWQGQVQRVIDELTPLVEAAASERSRETLQESLTYLTNNASRMHYDEYRRQGLPITTTLIESTIKQISRRMKGTEKFWCEGAEPQLQLCADRISETNPLASYWNRRAAQISGFRKSRATA